MSILRTIVCLPLLLSVFSCGQRQGTSNQVKEEHSSLKRAEVGLSFFTRNRDSKEIPFSLGKTVSEKAICLNRLQGQLDSISDERSKQEAFEKLPKNVQIKLDLLWAALYSDRGRKNIPTTGGRWTGEPGNSVWIPDDSVIPLNKGYNNLQEKTWEQIKAENNIHGIKYIDGRVDFVPVSKYEVVFDWEEALGPDGIKRLRDTGDRQYLHMYAFFLLAKQLSLSEAEVIKMKETQNLVWHEEPDCSTLRLVVREVHDNLKHFGGIAMLSIVYDD